MLRFSTLTLLLVAFPSAAVAQPNWVGKTIVPKKPGIKIGHTDDSGKQVHVATLDGIAYRVLSEKEDWLKVQTRPDVEGWFDKADAVLLDDAVAYFTGQIQRNPKDVFAYSARAAVAQFKGDVDSAIKDFGEALRLSPRAGIYANRGECWALKKDYDKAIADFSEAVRLDPSDGPAYYNRGVCRAFKKEHEQAIADFGEAIRLDPNHADAYNNRGVLLRQQKEYEKAVADFTAVIRLDAKDADAYDNRGVAWRDQQEYEKAIADFSEAIRLDPKHADAYSNRGLARFLSKEYDKAALDLDESQKLDARNAWVYKHRALLLATSADAKYRDGAKAVANAKMALELAENPEGDFHATLAAAHAEAGNFDEAVRSQQRALEDPDLQDDADAQKRLELYRKKQPYRQE